MVKSPRKPLEYHVLGGQHFPMPSTEKFTIEQVKPFAWNHDSLRQEELKNKVKMITKCSQCCIFIFLALRMASCVLVYGTFLRVVGAEWFFMPKIPRKSLKYCRKVV